MFVSLMCFFYPVLCLRHKRTQVFSPLFGLSKIANIVRDLTKTSPSGFQQMWFSLQLKKLRSVASGLSLAVVCFTEDFISSYSEALLLRKHVIIADDLSCNLLVNWPGLPAVSIQSRFDTSLFSRRRVNCLTYLAQGTKNSHPKGFLVHTQAILEVIEIFVEFHCLSLYRNDRLPSTALNPAR